MAANQLKDVLILANFDVTAQNVSTGFQYTGTWYNLMDNTTINVSDVNALINIPAGEFRIYGNKVANLAIADFEKGATVNLYPNPVSDYFTLNILAAKVQVYNISGQLVKSFSTNGKTDFQYEVSDLEAGLYIVKALVNLYKGEIEVQSIVNQGTVCNVKLNLTKVAVKEEVKLEAINNYNLHGKRILVVEDNAMNQMVLKMITKKWLGTEVDYAFNGEEGLEFLRKSKYDVILMDLQMPVMDGYEATIAIRSGNSGINDKNIPIIAVTADSSGLVVELFLKVVRAERVDP